MRASRLRAPGGGRAGQRQSLDALRLGRGRSKLLGPRRVAGGSLAVEGSLELYGARTSASKFRRVLQLGFIDFKPDAREFDQFLTRAEVIVPYRRRGAEKRRHSAFHEFRLLSFPIRIAAYNTGQVFVAGQTRLAKEKIKTEDGYVLDAENKRVPVVLQYSSFDFLNDKAKAIVETHVTEAAKRWNV